MDLKTIVAVVLSVVVIVVSLVVQSVFFKTDPVEEVAVPETAVEQEDKTQGEERDETESTRAQGEVSPAEREGREREIVRETDLYRITFSTFGGTVRSLQLKEFKNTDGTQVDMILFSDRDHYPFSIHFGDFTAPAAGGVYEFKEIRSNRWEFSKVFLSQTGVPFTVKKTYSFPYAEYLMELRITIENSVNDYPALDFEGISYTLGFGPQIGPPFEKLDNRNEYRHYLYYADGKRRDAKLDRGPVELDRRVLWTSIVGKYFGVIAVPGATDYRITYDATAVPGIPDRSSMFFSRPLLKSSKNTDTYKFYVGPKRRETLLQYNNPQENSYGIGDLHFEEVISTSVWIGWLANILKFFLELFYRVVPNYGVAIILLTILIKVILFPLTHKSYESTSKMQGLSGKVEEIRQKYKEKSERMNQEIAELYKKEGVNPLGGCLPLLLQLPIFLALFNLLSNHFELRGASFIASWIVDLSAPESVWDFSPLAIPILGWHNLRLLPFIMLGTTFLQSLLTQSPGSQGGQMKMLAYAMPIFFFFILYDMPSGLVLYWTMQNVLTIVQQLLINRVMNKGKGRSSPPRRN